MDVCVYPEVFSIARLEPNKSMPDFSGVDWYSVTRTPNELSIVAPKKWFEEKGIACAEEWSCISCSEVFDLSLTGITSSFTRPLADAGIPVFIVSSYDTDHILVPRDRCNEAVEIFNGVELR